MSSDTNELRPEDDVLAARLTLLSKGYEPLPVAGKRALTKGWPDDPITTERVRAECEAHPDWSNTGLRTGSLVGIDIDVVDPEQAEAVRALAEAHLGRSDMIREGSKGMMICYRNATPIRKITAGSSDRTKVEILGSRNQFVAYGVHPDTGRPYKWPNWDREPLLVPFADLPAVTPEQLRAFAHAAAALLREQGHPDVTVTGHLEERAATTAGDAPVLPGVPLPPDELKARIACLDPNMGRPAWVVIAGALHATPCTDPDFDKCGLFVDWSAGVYWPEDSFMFEGADDCEDVYNSMKPKPGGVGAGTFIRKTNVAGFTGPTVNRDNRPGGEVFAGALGPVVATSKPEPNEWAARVARFRGREPDEDADLPEPEFWDDDGLLPKFPGGSIGFIYGKSGDYKSTVALHLALKAVLERGARVLFLSGEGGYGMGKMRVPAECAALGITPGDLRGRFRKVDQVPILTDREDMRAVIEAHRDFRPNIVVIDTLATAIPGLDENAAATAALILPTSPIGAIRREFDACVAIVAHKGKAPGEDQRGSSGWRGNADFAHEVKAEKDKRIVELNARKVRDGPDGFTVHFRIESGLRGVPLARPIPKEEAQALMRDTTKRVADQARVQKALKSLGAGETRSTDVLARTLRPCPQDLDEEAYKKGPLHAEKVWLNDRAGRGGSLEAWAEKTSKGYFWEIPPDLDLDNAED